MNILHLILLMILNMIDYLMFYLLGSKLVNEKIPIPIKKSSIRMLTFGLTYGILIGLFAYAIQYNNVNSNIFRFVATVALFFVSKTIAKNTYLDSFLLFTITYLIILTFQMPLNFLLTALSLKGFYIDVPGQILSLIITILLFWKIPLYSFYNLVKYNIFMKLTLYIAICISYIVLSYANYSYTIANITYLLIFISLAIASLSAEMVRIFSSYRKQISENLHDTKNLIGGIHMTAHSTTDINVIRKNLDECIGLLQLQNSVLDTYEINEGKENILLFIQQKKERVKKDLGIITKIDYIDGHEKVPLGIFVYMLGTLLDNAIEYMVQRQIQHKPILIKLLIMDDTVEIHVSNPYETEVTEEFKRSFEKGYTTKSSHQHGRDERGYGLSNLKRVARKYGGIIYYGSEYLTDYDYRYLTITIEISCYSSWKAHELDKSTSYGDKTLFLVK